MSFCLLLSLLKITLQELLAWVCPSWDPPVCCQLTLATGQFFWRQDTSVPVKLFSLLGIVNTETFCDQSICDILTLSFLPQTDHGNIDTHGVDARQTRRDTPVKLNRKLIKPQLISSVVKKFSFHICLKCREVLTALCR